MAKPAKTAKEDNEVKPDLFISVAICCHNSEKRLPATLKRLALQSGECRLQWEVLLVDNASQDKTAETASNTWNSFSLSVPLRVVREQTPGLSHARKRAFAESSADVVCFLDDDNWVSENWLGAVYEIFSGQPEVGAAGGPIVEVLEKESPPFWFGQFKGNFTIWNPSEVAGYRDQPLCGAGLCIRRAAWQQLRQEGFDFQLTDRVGRQLSSGGDFELCYALLLSGWKLWYEPRMRIQHYMPESRLKWETLLRLQSGFGEQSVVFDAYKTAGEKLNPWWTEALKCAGGMLRQGFERVRNREGAAGRLLYENLKGRFLRLCKERGKYTGRAAEIRNASWNRSH